MSYSAFVMSESTHEVGSDASHLLLNCSYTCERGRKDHRFELPYWPQVIRGKLVGFSERRIHCKCTMCWGLVSDDKGVFCGIFEERKLQEEAGFLCARYAFLFLLKKLANITWDKWCETIFISSVSLRRKGDMELTQPTFLRKDESYCQQFAGCHEW